MNTVLPKANVGIVVRVRHRPAERVPSAKPMQVGCFVVLRCLPPLNHRPSLETFVPCCMLLLYRTSARCTTKFFNYLIFHRFSSAKQKNLQLSVSKDNDHRKKTPPSHCCQAGKGGVLLPERRGFEPRMHENASPECASIARTLPHATPRLCFPQKRGRCFSARGRRVLKTKCNYTKNKKSLYSFFALTDAKYFCYPSNVPKYVEFSKISILNIINIQ